MRKADGTEATLTKHSVEMESDIKEWKPLEPKDLVDYEPGEKEITDAMETVKVILKLSDIDTEPEEWFENQWYEVLRKKDWTVYITDWNGMGIDKDIVRRCLQLLYWGKYAYLKKWDFELYWPVDIKRYQRRLATPLGYITIPIITVNNTPVFFNSKWCLTDWEKTTYELYNNKSQDYDRMELEKKIMWDLILYSQIWTKTMDDSKALFEKIKKECENTGVLKRIAFDNWVFTLDFDWRIWFDTAKNQKPMVFPPFTITIDFVRKQLWLRGRHPHRYNWGFCLGWVLTDIKDRCFKEKDIYWLVMGMIQFAWEWNSSDVGHSDRHPWNCIIRTFQDNGYTDIRELPVSAWEILLTLIEYSYTYLLDNVDLREVLKEQLLNNEWFRKLFLERVNKEKRNSMINEVLTEKEREKDFIKELM